MASQSGFFTSTESIQFATDMQLELLYESLYGFSQIWKACIDGQYRILKTLKPNIRENAVYEALLRKEFEIGHSLHHPNICNYIAFGSNPDIGNYIEMEWIDGPNLRDFASSPECRRGTMGKLTEQICDALQHIHTKQIIHRDLKPDNILVTRNGHYIKIIDFGFADSDSHCYLKSAAGTKVYAAPELLSGGTADCRSDIYSLGIILEELNISGKIRRIARKCSNADPEKRYQDISEVKNALDKKSFTGIIISLAIIIASAAALIMLYNDRSRCSAADIDNIMEQATEMIEEACHNDNNTSL